MKKTSTLALAIFLLMLNVTTKAQTSGTVFRDLNGNGTRQTSVPNEPLVKGIIVNAYNISDALIASYTTTTAGTFSIPLTGSIYNGTVGSNTGSVASAAAIRLEFIIPASGACGLDPNIDYSSGNGSTVGSSVRFVTGGATAITYAINKPSDFVSTTNPMVYMSRQTSGNPLGGGTSGTSNWFIGFPYNTTGTVAPTLALNGTTIGATWGVAYSRQAGKVFTSAFLKRHVGLGVLGSGGIYLLTPTATSFTVVNFYDMDAATNGGAYRTRADAAATPPTYGSTTSYSLTGSNTIINYLGSIDAASGKPVGMGVIGTNVNRGLPAANTLENWDPAAFDQVGKVGLGDLEISDDGKYLFSINLYDRKVYRLELNNAYNPTSVIAVTSYALPATTVTNGVLRPFGAKFYRGKLYVGAVATAENAGTAANLRAYVFELNNAASSPAFTATPVVNYALNYAKGSAMTWTGPYGLQWYPWSNNTTTTVGINNDRTYPTPILANIEFDDRGDMIMSFFDRGGHQWSEDNYQDLAVSTTLMRYAVGGDVLIAGSNCNGTFSIENNGAYTSSNGASYNSGVANNEGLGISEFFKGDNFGTTHSETAIGGLGYLPGSGELFFGAMDPLAINSGGVKRLSMATGLEVASSGYQLAGGSIAGFGKAISLGDIEFFGTEPPIELGNRIWNDTDGDGIQEPGESGIAGVTLELVDATGNPVDSDLGTAGVQPTFVTTDATGNWYITSATGTDATGVNYGVALLPNTQYRLRLATGAGDDWDPTANGGQGGPRAGQQLVSYKLTKTNSIGSGAVDLSDNDAALVASTPEISIATGGFGQNNHNVDFGFTRLASLGNKVWLDQGSGGGIAQDGVQNGTEPGVAGVAVNLYQNGVDGLPGTADDVLIGSTITDAYGMYMFDNLQPTDQTNATTIGQTSYNVRVTPASNYSITTQTNTTDDNNTTGASTTGSDVNVLGVSYSVNLSSGENNPNIDAGLIFKTAPAVNSIGDRVWFDNGAGALGGNGVQDAGEPGVAGITVTLYDDVTGNIVAITTTDANGNYLFNNLPANTNYKIGFSAPAGTVFTTGGTLSTGNATTNSDPSPITGITTTINSGVAGTQITGVDAGIKNDAKGALGDYVWNDLNRNGIQDAGEPGVAGVTMRLYGTGPDGLVGGGDDVLLSTTTTDANGYYVFPNLDPAKYFVVATPVSGYTNSVANQGTNDTKDTDFGTGTGAYVGSYVSGLYTLLPIAGGVTRDMTIDLGIYSNATVNTLNTLGDKVWNDLNKDGLQTAGEAGVPNITVRLLTSAGAAVNNPATGKPYVVVTDANGNYKFVDLPDGNYIVEFANLPAGYSFTGQDASGSGAPGSGTDGTNDSDVKTTTGRTAVISVDATSVSATSVNIITVDAGITQGISAGTASLGNRVWYDINNNGLQDAGELGVNNVRVELLDALGSAVDSDPNTAGIQPYVIYTNALGEYLFTGLPAGDYTVRFSRLPAGYTSSASNAGTNDAIDADANYAGSSVTATTTATTGIYTLQIGEDNLTVDMGIVPPTTGSNNSLGNYVWSDLNADGKQTIGEQGVQGVTVTLYTNGVDGLPGTADDVRVGVTTTDNNGAYVFVGLADGNYNVGFTNLPAGFTFTDQNKAGSTAADGSDANTASGRTTTYALDPTSASATAVNDPTVDGGLISTRAALGNFVWLDTNGDGVQDVTEKGISGVTVILYATDGTTVLASTITDADGKYYFGNLTPGDYRVGFSTIPSNLVFTQQNTPGDNGNNTNSDAVPATPTAITAITGVITLVAGETDLTADAGLKPNNDASVGNFVWNDVNGNGVQDANEPGVPGIIVTLYDVANNVVGTAVTDGNGNYLISKIPAGTGYYIIFSNLQGTATFTTRTDNVSAADVSLGSDPNPANGRTSAFSLTAGQYLPTVDAGIINILLLPIKITSFTALPKGSQVDLQWTISEQTNIASYQVLFSTDGRNFNTAIAIVAANINSSATYNAVHTTPVAGINYYRIKTIEKDGTISYSEIRKVTFGKSGTITVYPNPAVDMVNITVTGSMINKAATISIIAMDGKLVSQQRIANIGQTETVDVSKLASGSYIIRLVTDTETVNTILQIKS